MIDARDLLSEAIRTLESKAGPGDPDTVTITISREDANLLANYMELDYPEMTRIARAVRAALEGER